MMRVDWNLFTGMTRNRIMLIKEKSMKQTVKTVVFRCAISLGLLAQLSIVLPAHAEIFKCTNKQGKVYYNDKPCPVESDEKKLQNEKDPVNGYVPQQAKQPGNVVKDKNSANNPPPESSFYKPDQQDSSDETKTKDSDDPSGPGHRGVIADPATRERIPIKHFQDENKKVKSMKTESHPMPVDKRRPDGKLSLDEKKALLGINSEPE